MSAHTRFWELVYPSSMISYADETEAKRDFEAIKSRITKAYESPFKLTFSHKYSGSMLTLTKCVNCKHSFKLEDGTYICKYSTNKGKPESATCKYERKTR